MFAQTLIKSYAEQNNTGTTKFGEIVKNIGDFNSDGFDDIAVVAKYYGSQRGKVYIYFGGSDSDNIPDLTMEGEENFTFFGTSVSGAGDFNGDGNSDFIIGCANINSNKGRAYIYYGGADVDNIPDLTIEGETANRYLGAVVSGIGDFNNDGYDDIVVAESFHERNAYLYLGGADPDAVSDLTITGDMSVNWGSSISSAGDFNNDGYDDIIIGAYGYSSSKGRAYIYYGGSTLDATADIIVTGGSNNLELGQSVAGGGDFNKDGIDDVIIGVPRDDSNKGSVYVLYGSDNPDGVKDIVLKGDDTQTYFGKSVSFAGDMNNDGADDIIVGVNTHLIGNAYIFYGGDTPVTNYSLKLTGKASGDRFGNSVSAAGDVDNDGYDDVIVGAYNSEVSTGKSYLYRGGATPDDIDDITYKGEGSGNYYGREMSVIGDINSDGYDDFIVGATGYDGSSGAAYLYLGSDSPDKEFKVTGGIYHNLGYGVSGLGDINGDGYDDFVVGTNKNKAYIYLGGVTPDNIADLELEGLTTGEHFGKRCSGIGDINNDGFDDFIVGAENFGTGTNSNEKFFGKVYIYFGGTDINNLTVETIQGELFKNFFGRVVTGVGDMNGDGYGDFAISALGYDSYKGRVYVYYGGTTFDETPDIIYTGEVLNIGFGDRVSAAGDVNGDGYDDIMIGSNRHNSSRGRTSVYYGGSTPDNIADVNIYGESIGDYVGNSMVDIGDLNRDGYDDIAIGLHGKNTRTGEVRIYFGAASMDTNPDMIIEGSEQELRFGETLAGGGDINNDGYPDILIGETYFDNQNGKVYLYSFSNDPQVSTVSVTDIGVSVVTANANVSKLGDDNIIGHGFCWHTETEPTISDNSIDKGELTSTGSFLGSVTGLSANTTYYIRSFVRSSRKVFYGDELSFTTKTAQTITFNTLSAKSYGDANFDLTATASSNLVVSYQSSDTDVATVSGNTVTIVGAGTTTITASQSGNDTYAAATAVGQNLVVNKSSQTITFGLLPQKQYGDGGFDLSATSSSALAITYESSNTDVATVSGNTVTITGGGTTTITASQAGNANYQGATAGQVLIVNKATQTIVFASPAPKTYGDDDFELSATASSNLEVTYISSDTDVATVSGNTVTIKGGGTTTITAMQAGNTNYLAATTVNHNLIVNKADQAITFNALESTTYGNDFNLSASSSSGLDISYESSNTDVATISGKRVTIVGVGTTTITASQIGNGNYNVANTVDQELIVDKATQAIEMETISFKAITDKTFALDEVSSSGLPIEYSSSNTNVATIDDYIVTIVGIGKTIITAKQLGNENYIAAPEVQQELIISKETQKITFAELESVTYGDVSFNLNATSTSGLPVTFSSSNTDVVAITGNSVTVVGAGETIITAKQEGNGEYEATSTERRLTVNKANQSITFETIEAKYVGDKSFDLSATASSGLDIVYISSDEKVATVSGKTVTIVGTGITTITASQSGNNNYNAATNVQQALTVFSTSDINSADEAGIKLYPNPVSDILNIDSEKYIDLVQILDMESRMIRSIDVDGYNKSVDVGTLNKGVYLVKIKSGNKLYIIRLVKK
jgi:hypothetical protein